MSTEAGTALALIEPEAVELGVLHGSTPRALVEAATAAADALAGVIEKKKLYNVISGRRFVRCEGWTALGALLGLLPREVSVTGDESGRYVAVVELVRMSDGVMLTRASAECGGDEPMWDKRPNYARRSMAVTRATSKACRIGLSWIMALSGYEVTPAEEMPAERPADVDDDGVVDDAPHGFTLPGASSKWDGHGGKLLGEVPVEILSKARAWLTKKADPKNDALLKAMDVEIGRRVPLAASGPLIPTSIPKPLSEMPKGIDEDALDDGLPFD